MKNRAAWIRVSHSHRDLEKVRRIRNELERRGHNPLLFFLKCLEVFHRGILTAERADIMMPT